MGDTLTAALYAVLLAAGWVSSRAPGAPVGRSSVRPPWATLLALFVVGGTSLVQLAAAPDMLGALQRVPEELENGQLWRLLTSLLVQDGGWSGAAFNLVALAALGVTAERFWGFSRWWVVWLVAGVGAQFWGLLVQPTGGGNSVATFGLAASLAVVAVLRGRGAARPAGAVCLLAGLIFFAGRDVYGGAAVLGAGTGLLLARSGPAPVSRRARRPSRGR